MTARARLIAIQGSRKAWEHGGQVAITQTEEVWGQPGIPFPVNSRWECSLAHWNHYYPTVHAPAGWTTHTLARYRVVWADGALPEILASWTAAQERIRERYPLADFYRVVAATPTTWEVYKTYGAVGSPVARVVESPPKPYPAPYRLRTVVGYAAHARELATWSEETIGWIPRCVHGPYAYAPTHAVSLDPDGKAVFCVEIKHRRFAVYAVDRASVHADEETAMAQYERHVAT